MSPLINATDLLQRTASDWVILDCRFDLANPHGGEAAYAHGHIPGAQYAHLDQHLSSPVTDASGRHPLPDASAWAEQMGRWGITPETQVVVYDDAGGAFAARAWWLLRWMGHTRVALLDGGINAWIQAGGGLTVDTDAPAPWSPYPGPAGQMPTVSADDIIANLSSPNQALVDARAAPRFEGRAEPIDPVAGHVPRAINRPLGENLTQEGCFKTAAQLREEWLAVLGDKSCIAMCGSGVTACHHLLALEVAGISESALYPGSWSEWIRDPARPVAQSIDQPSSIG